MKALLLLLFLSAPACAQLHSAEEPAPYRPTVCEGTYAKHLQGLCTDGSNAIYWCWTDVLVKTDREGLVLKRVPVADHHGDLCFHDGRVYVAVNLGKFNEPPGKADSWVYVYDAKSLAELARHPVPEVVHGAGGMAFHQGRFIVAGGLPPGVTENYLYEYDPAFKFQKRHVLASGHTDKGIQTVAFADGAWWFGCYGKPKILLRADASFKFTGKWEFDASLGIVGQEDGSLLIGGNTKTAGEGYKGRMTVARPDEERGLVLQQE